MAFLAGLMAMVRGTNSNLRRSAEADERESASLVLCALWNEQERMRAQYEADVLALTARIAQLEARGAEPDVDGEPEPLGSSWVSLKQAAFLSGRSETGIRKLRDAGKIGAVHRGGRWHFDMTSIKPKVRSRTLVRTVEVGALSTNGILPNIPT